MIFGPLRLFCVFVNVKLQSIQEVVYEY